MYLPKQCFVVMPFGERDVRRADATTKKVDFNAVYKDFLKPVVEKLGFTCERCDYLKAGGDIHKKMFENLYGSGLVLVDITTLNPNVLYELGARHALVKGHTVIIRQEEGTPPFNFLHHEVIHYDPENEEGQKELRRRIAEMLSASSEAGGCDSPVLNKLDLRISERSPAIAKQSVYRYVVRDHPTDEIRLVTGDLLHVKDVDIWVNSENTHMLMARHIEKSISSAIRYGGATKLPNGKIEHDHVHDELVSCMNGVDQVEEAAIVVTGPGELAKTNGVKKIFHAASARGAPGKGFQQIDDVGQCVRNALRKADELDEKGLESIVFPLLGTGQARGLVEKTAKTLLAAAIDHLAENPGSRIDHVYFVTYTERELEFCKRFLDAHPRVDFQGKT